MRYVVTVCRPTFFESTENPTWGAQEEVAWEQWYVAPFVSKTAVLEQKRTTQDHQCGDTSTQVRTRCAFYLNILGVTHL